MKLLIFLYLSPGVMYKSRVYTGSGITAPEFTFPRWHPIIFQSGYTHLTPTSSVELFSVIHIFTDTSYQILSFCHSREHRMISPDRLNLHFPDYKWPGESFLVFLQLLFIQSFQLWIGLFFFLLYKKIFSILRLDILFFFWKMLKFYSSHFYLTHLVLSFSSLWEGLTSFFSIWLGWPSTVY